MAGKISSGIQSPGVRPARAILARAPSDPLKPFIRCFRLIEYADAHADEHLPHPGISVVLHLGGGTILDGGAAAPRAAVTGLWSRPRSHRHLPGSRLAIVSFTFAGAAALLGSPMGELKNSTEPVDAVAASPRAWESLVERMSEADDAGRRFDLLDRFFRDRCTERAIDPVAGFAARRIVGANGQISIARLVAASGLSESAFLRRFRDHIGASPKTFASVVRLQRVLRLGPSAHDFTTLAMDAGYYDQSHFIRDFRAMTGQAPGSFFRDEATGRAGFLQSANPGRD
jgi:AraC-like DNA-binding protein